MRIYLASPGNQLQADAVRGMPVLVSYGGLPKFRAVEQWMPSFSHCLIDSGAYTVYKNSGFQIDLSAYIDWAQSIDYADACAGLDDVEGDWRKSLKAYERFGFPTMHNSDPDELLDELIPIARERGGWLGIGLQEPRQGNEPWLRRTLERVPDDLHVHGWALGMYTHVPRLDSIDSTHWWREAMKYRTQMPWLTYGETLEIAVKKIQRLQRMKHTDTQESLFGDET